MNERAIKNRRILIKNMEDGRIIADTKILRFDSLANSVIISAGALAVRKYYRISAYIFADECLYEFSGTIRGAIVDNEIEVFLGRRKMKEDRAKTRYPVALGGMINGIIIEGREIRIRRPMRIRTINMSANGILMQADAGSFDIGDCIVVALETERNSIEVSCKIVRIQGSGSLTEEYGCRINEIRAEGDRDMYLRTSVARK